MACALSSLRRESKWKAFAQAPSDPNVRASTLFESVDALNTNGALLVVDDDPGCYVPTLQTAEDRVDLRQGLHFDVGVHLAACSEVQCLSHVLARSYE